MPVLTGRPSIIGRRNQAILYSVQLWLSRRKLVDERKVEFVEKYSGSRGNNSSYRNWIKLPTISGNDRRPLANIK
jgi:hypothetical protein